MSNPTYKEVLAAREVLNNFDLHQKKIKEERNENRLRIRAFHCMDKTERTRLYLEVYKNELSELLSNHKLHKTLDNYDNDIWPNYYLKETTKLREFLTLYRRRLKEDLK